MLPRYTTDLQIDSTRNGVRYYNTALTIPITQDVFQFKVVAQDGDRFDSLAARYYKDASKWWIIAKANGYINGTMFVPGGVELIIPSVGLL
jgi:nucleoid-associated protein YgaU